MSLEFVERYTKPHSLRPCVLCLLTALHKELPLLLPYNLLDTVIKRIVALGKGKRRSHRLSILSSSSSLSLLIRKMFGSMLTLIDNLPFEKEHNFCRSYCENSFILIITHLFSKLKNTWTGTMAGMVIDRYIFWKCNIFPGVIEGV